MKRAICIVVILAYAFAGLVSGGTYTMTPSKSDLVPAVAGISTVDAVAVQRHFLSIAFIPPGCQLMAADVNGDSKVSTADALAIQRFGLGQTIGIGNAGKYEFNPPSRSYAGLVTNQTAQNYDTLVFGDVVSGFVHRPDGLPPSDAGNEASHETNSVVETVSLQNGDIEQAKSTFIAALRTSELNEKDKLVGFQGDLSFDERVIAFQEPVVQKAGLTSGNWTVSGNVLPGTGPIRTLRVSAFSNDFAPLSGSGTLFELNMTRVSETVQDMPLVWTKVPGQFYFIDADLKTKRPE